MAASKCFSSVEYTVADVWADAGPDWLSRRGTKTTCDTLSQSGGIDENGSLSEGSIGAPPGLDFMFDADPGDVSQLSTDDPHSDTFSPRTSEDIMSSKDTLSTGRSCSKDSCDVPVISLARAARKANSIQRFERYEGPVTTWMIRNIPCRFTQDDMMKIIDSHGFAGTFDFFYMPSASRNSKVSASSFGYGFINFSDSCVCGRFQQTFHGYRFEGTVSTKVCDIQPAHLQGLEPNIQCFHGRTSRKGFQPFIRRSCPNNKRKGSKGIQQSHALAAPRAQDRAHWSERTVPRREPVQKPCRPMADGEKMPSAPPGVWSPQSPTDGPAQYQGYGGYPMETSPQWGVFTL